MLCLLRESALISRFSVIFRVVLKIKNMPILLTPKPTRGSVPPREGEVHVPEIMCPDCGTKRLLSHGDRVPDEVVRGVLVCAGVGCGKWLPFAFSGESVTLAPQQHIWPPLLPSVPVTAAAVFLEAELSFYGAAYRAAVVMARAAMEAALKAAGVKGKDLFDLINNSGLSKGLKIAAHDARFLGNGAIHETSPDVVPLTALLALDTAARVANRLPYPRVKDKNASS